MAKSFLDMVSEGKPISLLAEHGVANHVISKLTSAGIMTCELILHFTKADLAYVAGLSPNQVNKVRIASQNIVGMDNLRKLHFVLVENLARTTTEEYLRSEFRRPCGGVLFAHIPSQRILKRRNKFGLVFFKDHKNVEKAVVRMNRSVIDDSKVFVKRCIPWHVEREAETSNPFEVQSSTPVGEVAVRVDEVKSIAI